MIRAELRVILGDLRWSQLISSDLGQMSGWSQADLRSPKYFELHCKNLWIFSWFQKTWGNLRWCQVMSGSIIKYQMIWRDLSWTEVILGDLSWSQLISECIWDNIGWSQVISIYLKCCELNYEDLRLFSLISEDLRWSQVSWGDLQSCQAI